MIEKPEARVIEFEGGIDSPQFREWLNSHSRKPKKTLPRLSLGFAISGVFALAIIILLVVGLYSGIQALQFTQSSQLNHLHPQLSTENALTLASAQSAEASSKIQAWNVIVQLLSALALALTLAFTALNVRHANEQLEIARADRAQAQLQFDATVERQDVQITLALRGQLTERFTRATDQLGSASTMTRLGGIRSLARIAHESAEDYWASIEILSAFVRENAPRDQIGQEPGALYGSVRVDVQAAVRAIIERNRNIVAVEGGRVDLHGTMLRGIDMSMGDLSHAILSNADMSRANLSNADFFLANLGGADLSGSSLAWSKFVGANLSGANLSGAKMYGVSLHSWEYTIVDNDYFLIDDARKSAGDEPTRGWLSTNLSEANLGGANLSGKNLRGVNLLGADLSEADLTGADLSFATGLTQAQIDKTYMDEKTILPESLGPDGKPYRRSSRQRQNT